MTYNVFGGTNLTQPISDPSSWLQTALHNKLEEVQGWTNQPV